MHIAKVTSKGRVAIPKRVRGLLAITSGDHVAFEIDTHGSLRVSRLSSGDVLLRGLMAE